MRHWSFGPLVGLASSIPIMTAAMRAARMGWQPVSDDAVIALRSFDVLTARSPLLGQATTATEAGATVAHSPGPMLYWLFALPARVGPAWLPAAVAALVGVVAFVAIVTVAQRRGGPGLAVLVGLGLTLVVRAVDPFYLASVWNPVAVLVPFTLFLFVAWSVASGSRRLFPVAVVLASLCVQSHLTYLVPCLAVLAVSTVAGFGPALGSLVRTRSSSAAELDEGPAADAEHPVRPGGPLGPVRWLVAGAVAGGLCWALPLWQQVTGSPGNVTVLARSGDSLGPGLGVRRGIYALVQSVAFPPRFVGPSHTFDPFVPVAMPSLLEWLTAGLLAVSIGWLLVTAIGRRDRGVVAGLILALVAGGSAVVATATVPRNDARVLTLGYTLLWLVPLGLFVWTLVLRAALVEVAARRSNRSASSVTSRGAVPARVVEVWSRTRLPATLAVLAIVVGVGGFTGGDDPFRWTYPPATTIGDAAAARVVPGQDYRLEVDPRVEGLYLPTLAYRVRRAGSTPIAAERYGELLGADYAPSGQGCAGTLRLTTPDRAADPVDGDELLAMASIDAPNPAVPEIVELWMVSEPEGRDC